ncbi:MAG TPA: GntR family transcriptional regulator [Chthoniobacteraceae bacterium]|nr:GntR family transcriptional regulator [Chthoniobacteraceae bacterium]
MKLLPAQYRAGDRLPRELDLCRQLGVSLMTLREALAILYHEGIVERKRGSGTYYVGKRRKRHVAVLVPWQKHGRHGLSPGLREGVAHLLEGLREDGVPHRVYIGRQLERENVFTYGYPELGGAAARGEVLAALNPCGRVDETDLAGLKASGVPLCGCSSRADARVTHQVPEGIRTAIAWLAARGRRRVAYMDVLARSGGDAGSSSERFAAFCEGLYEARLPIVREWILRDFHPGRSGAGWSNLREIWSARPEKPDALICCDETFLPEVVTALGELGIETPGQLSIVSHATAGYLPDPARVSAIIETDPQAYAAVLREQAASLVAGTPLATEIRRLPARWVVMEGKAAEASGVPGVVAH